MSELYEFDGVIHEDLDSGGAYVKLGSSLILRVS